jgi:uncharacterized membrane protein YqjE
MEAPADQPAGIAASFKRLLRTTLAIGRNRLELFLVELQEERLQFVGVLLLAGIVVFLACMTVAILTVTVVVLCIRSGRFDLLAGLILLYSVATLVAGWRLQRRLKQWVPFPATLAELKKDEACLDEES